MDQRPKTPGAVGHSGASDHGALVSTHLLGPSSWTKSCAEAPFWNWSGKKGAEEGFLPS